VKVKANDFPVRDRHKADLWDWRIRVDSFCPSRNAFREHLQAHVTGVGARLIVPPIVLATLDGMDIVYRKTKDQRRQELLANREGRVG
jgi:hypothetical protein